MTTTVTDVAQVDADEPSRPCQRMRILLVDDNQDNLYSVQTALEPLGEEILSASSGKEALRLCLDHDFAVILVDVRMPDMDGFETAEFIRSRKRSKHTPLLFLTAYRSDEQLFRGYDLGAVDFLFWPLVPEILQSKVRVFVELSRTAEALRQANAYNRSLIEASLDPLVTISHTGKITDVNEATEKVTGTSRDRLIGSDFSDYFTEPEMARQVYPRVFSEGAVRDYPLAIRSTSGLVTDVLYNASVFKNEAGDVVGLCAAARDITERKRAEEKVRQLSRELEKRVQQRTAQLKERTVELETANKELEAFCYSVSHDLRAPLRAICGFTQILMDEHKQELSPEAQQCLDRVWQGGMHMGRLTDDLLAFARLGRQDVNKKLVSMNEVVRLAIEDLSLDRGGRQIEFVVESLPSCEVDAALLRQVFVNLLSNSVKFTRTREQARVEIGTLTSEERKRLSGGQPVGCPPEILDSDIPIFYVRDNGIGFDMRYVDKLFGVFQRLHRADEFEGTGIGLAIVQRVIHRHGGRVWAEAKPNEGATFYFTLEGGT